MQQEETDDLCRLAAAARAGDSDALLRLVDALRGPVFSHAFHVLGSYEDAQDAVAPALLRISRGIGRLRDPEQIQAWVRRVARNEALRVRAATPRNEILPEDLPAARTSDTALGLDIEAALHRLPQAQARAVWLFYIDRLSVSEIAGAMDVPAGTVKFWLHRARHQLATTLEEYAPMSIEKREAFIVHSAFTPDEATGLSDALRAAGWPTVRFVTDYTAAAALLKRASENELEAETAIPRFVLTDETIAQRSAFELFPLWNAGPKRTHTAVMLLAAGARPEEEFGITAMAAYLSGVDFMLSKPYDLREVESFARRARTTLEGQASPQTA